MQAMKIIEAKEGDLNLFFSSKRNQLQVRNSQKTFLSIDSDKSY